MESKTDNDESKVAEDNDNQGSTGDVEDTEETKGQAKKGKDAKKKKKNKEEKAIDVDALLLKDEDIDDDFVKEAKPFRTWAKEKGSRHAKNALLRVHQARAINMPQNLDVRLKRVHKTLRNTYFPDQAPRLMTDLWWSVKKGNLAEVRRLFDIGEYNVDCTDDPWGLHQTALHWACKTKSAECTMARFLIEERGARVDIQDTNGNLPLHIACYTGCEETALLCYHHGNTMDLHLRNWDAGISPLQCAASKGHRHVMRPLVHELDKKWVLEFTDDLVDELLFGANGAKERKAWLEQESKRIEDQASEDHDSSGEADHVEGRDFAEWE